MARSGKRQEPTLTRQEAARRAGVHVNSIRLWEKKGLLNPIRSGSPGLEEVRILEAELDEVMSSRSPRGPRAGSRVIQLERRVAALEAENALLREEIERARDERVQLIDALARRR